MLFALLLLQAPLPLALTCDGGGSAVREDVATVYGAQNSGNSAWPTAHDKRNETFQDRVEIRIAGNQGKIRLPATMLPAIPGDDEAWFKLSDLKLTEGSITASAAVNLMSRPKVHIDRSTGAIRISGRTAAYRGTCTPASS
ncbi:MAG: hypothetical protein MT490_16935 [Sphingomonas sp.]|uniref:hypothetical protein n=1 Tax=Sphingomonas sp. TaxID=28214 RepID=UPI002273F0E5|nr:hypothetical protein [Sphingomonas sp.]MCX8477477.1 hypothetical protein [Sphingomonas sp.]